MSYLAVGIVTNKSGIWEVYYHRKKAKYAFFEAAVYKKCIAS